jgi:hypothetical protein
VNLSGEPCFLPSPIKAKKKAKSSHTRRNFSGFKAKAAILEGAIIRAASTSPINEMIWPCGFNTLKRAVDYLLKPFRLQEFKEKVERALR